MWGSVMIFCLLDPILQDGVFKMSLSPDGTLLAAIHLSGQLSLWEIPSLRHQKEWRQELQVIYF